MSELKAFVARKIDDGTCDPVPCIEVYSKSEADKVIAKLEQDVESWIGSYEASRRINARTESKLRHSNYKRCMDNSFICFCMKRDANEKSFQAYNKRRMDIMQKWNNKTIRYEKYQFKWFELANKFKKEK